MVRIHDWTSPLLPGGPGSRELRNRTLRLLIRVKHHAARPSSRRAPWNLPEPEREARHTLVDLLQITTLEETAENGGHETAGQVTLHPSASRPRMWPEVPPSKPYAMQCEMPLSLFHISRRQGLPMRGSSARPLPSRRSSPRAVSSILPSYIP